MNTAQPYWKNFLSIFDKDTLLHLRIPFSFYLLPIFCFGLSQAHHIHWQNSILVFLILHFLIYPGSNIYNSYMDKDEGSIGGLKNPPRVTKKLYYMSILCDGMGLLFSLLIGVPFAILILFYILVSKAYSWNGIRLKKYGVLSWLIVMIFQGGYTYMMVNMAAFNQIDVKWISPQQWLALTAASVLVGGFYPLTQIYQHNEDSKRGDRTISFLLGVKGTFLFSGILFIIAFSLLYFYFTLYFSPTHFYLFLVFIVPSVIYFLMWFLHSIKNEREASFERAMMMNNLSSGLLIICFITLLLLNNLF